MNPEAITCPVNATVEEAARLMRDEGIGDVMVMDGDHFRGIVTDRDIVVRAIAEGESPRECQLVDIVSGDVATVTPDDEVDQAVRLMRERAVRRLPVLDAGRPVGMVAIGDLAIERDSDSALADISAAPPNN